MSYKHYQKEKVIQSIKSLNKQILNDFISLKQQFQSLHIHNNQISNTLKTWKTKFQQSVQNCLKDFVVQPTEMNQQSKSGVSHSSLVKQLTLLYGNDQEYIEAIKCLNSTTDMIKEYIRIKAIKDPTTAVVQKQVTSNQNVIIGSVGKIDV